MRRITKEEMDNSTVRRYFPERRASTPDTRFPDEARLYQAVTSMCEKR